MENLILSFTVVFPLAMQMALGYGMKQVGLFDEHTLAKCNKLTFRVFLPCLLFCNIYNSDFSKVFHLRFIITCALTVVVIFLSLMVLVPIFEKNNAKRGVLVQGIFRSNFILFGLPVATSLFGSEDLGTISIMMAIIVPMYNIFAVLSLEVFRGGRPDFRVILKNICKNPLILAAALALLCLFFHIPVPGVLLTTASETGKIATPFALMVLGGTFEFAKLKGNLAEMAVGVIGRLVVVPAIFLPIFAAMGFRGIDMGTAMVMLATPTAVSSFPMAVELEADGTLAGQIVVGTTLFSIFTVFFWIFFLKQVGWM